MSLRTIRAVAAMVMIAVGLCSTSQAAQSARGLYESTLAREQAARLALARGRQVGRVELMAIVTSYERIARAYPGSGYSDNALWQGAGVAATAFEMFGSARDRRTAIRLLRDLRARYTASSLLPKARSELARLETLSAAPGVQRTSSNPPDVQRSSLRSPTPIQRTGAPLRSPASSMVTTPAGPASLIRSIERVVMPDIVRVVVELDREVAFRDDQLPSPARMFVDFAGARPAPALSDRVLRYDSDVVRQIRVGRHPNAVTRVVLDFDGVSAYSVYPMYNPYRLVIDCERAGRQDPRFSPIASSVFGPRPHALPRIAPVDTAPPEIDADPVKVAGLLKAPAAAAAPIPGPLPPVAPGPAPHATKPPVLARAKPAAAAKPPATATKPTISPAPFPVPADPAPAPVAAKTVPSPAPVVARTIPVPEPLELPKTPVPASPPPANPASPPPSVPSTNLRGGFSLARQLGLGISRIVIDPGHGGHDPGASGRGVTEAELVLDVALKLEQRLLKIPGVEVVLTRRTNVYVPLDERTAIANRAEADLFLSIHANASRNERARGVETYFLNFASSSDAAAVAARENSASGGSMNSLPDIVRAIALNNKVDESRDFATYVQRAMTDKLRTHNKDLRDLGVKQAPFVVLIGAAMPSVLAEISFVTNRNEAQLLRGTAYRQRIADALLEGISRYQRALKRAPSIADGQVGAAKP
jgi:N-acetylmuramoyl-L-alanine amidase